MELSARAYSPRQSDRLKTFIFIATLSLGGV